MLYSLIHSFSAANAKLFLSVVCLVAGTDIGEPQCYAWMR